MDHYSVPIVLLVALCWLSVGTYAQTNTTAAPNTTATNATMTASNTTMGGSNTTASNETASSNATTNATATTSTPMTSGNTTMGGSNVTTNATVNSTATTMPATTIDPSATIVANDTVVELSTNISNAECGSTQLCAAKPSDCSPDSGSCYFLGAKKKGGRNFAFSLSGETDGYLGAALKSLNSVNETVYLCINNNGVGKFISAFLNNGTFYKQTFPVNNVKVKVRGKKIQCTFDATVPNSTARATDTEFALSVVNGTYNATSGELGTPTTQFKTTTVDLSTPVNVSTTAAPTVASAVPLQYSVSNGLLIILGVLSLAWL